MNPVNPSQNVSFPSNGNEAHGYVALPEGGRGPGVIVIQEWWGLTSHIVDITDRLAREGFVALAPDLFGGATTHDAGEAQKLMSSLPADRAARDLAGAVDYLLGRPEVTGEKVGAIGFCMGGGFVLTLAQQQGDRVAAAVPFYGVMAEVPDDLSNLTADIQGHYAEQDDFVPVDGVHQLADKIEQQAGKKPEILFYPAGHAFLNDENLLGTYDPEQATKAWERAVSFLHAKLG
ncbi:MAG: dienelactone hydrolase family protein [Actinomycetes bacterium]